MCFPVRAHLASSTGLCSGRRTKVLANVRSGRTTKGNRWLREMLVQCGWAASHTKDTYLSAQFWRLAARRGQKRAAVAVGHTLVVILYHLLRKRTTYQELGGDYFDRLGEERLTKGLVKRLERLGHKVKLEPATQTA